MATLKFKGKSPFEDNDKRSHDVSDYKYERYKESVSAQGKHSAPVNAAIFGLGRAGSIHLANIKANPRVNLKYIVEANTAIWEGIKNQWNLKDVTFVKPEDADQVYNDPELQACFICTPTFTHEEFILGSLQGGKAVFGEKPISQDPEGTKRCYAKAAEMGKPLFCAFNRRFDPSFSSVQQKVRSGVLGHVQRVKTVSRDSPLPSMAYLKISGGIFHDCAVHDIDLITWILGEYPAEVYVAANAQIPEIGAINDHDNVAITLKFNSGTIAMIDICRFANYGYDQRLEVFGHSGMLDVKNDTPNRTEYSTAGDTSEAPIYYSFPSRHHDGYRRELDHFLDVVQKGESMSVTDRMTSAVSKVADACEESAKSGMPVKLIWASEEIPEDYVQV
eukprot:TRINITY_DN806_c0_g1_i1.p1 TRINITY_DN806_c0_g1~~TRINITY_DN806_c0_g1_i1.p1  ORF type:complete len:390 (-),score=86.89 TRINITY_DN806_c0_g1_i1:164-1333(-)